MIKLYRKENSQQADMIEAEFRDLILRNGPCGRCRAGGKADVRRGNESVRDHGQ